MPAYSMNIRLAALGLLQMDPEQASCLTYRRKRAKRVPRGYTKRNCLKGSTNKKTVYSYNASLWLRDSAVHWSFVL
jgi:hypothetical protein